MTMGLRTSNPLDKRLYEIWRKMHYRCESETHPSYARYGGRGIKVCKEWGSLIVFGKWAIDNGYAPELTLDRINNDGNYSPDNCRWATPSEQANNKGVGIQVTLDPQQTVKKTFSVRQRKTGWEYRIELPRIEGKRRSVSKLGFSTKEAAVEAATRYILSNVSTVLSTK